MTFIDAWLVWLLAATQPNVPTASQPATPSAVTAVHPTHRSTAGTRVWTVSTQTTVAPVITGRSDIREATQISNGY